MTTTVIDEAVRKSDENRMRWCRMYTLLTGREDVFHLSTEAIADHALRAAQDAANAGPVDCPSPRSANPYTPEQLEIVGLRAELIQERIARAREQGAHSEAAATALRAVIVASEAVSDLISHWAEETEADMFRRQGALVAYLHTAMAALGGADE